LKGYQITLQDSKDEAPEQALPQMRHDFDFLVKTGLLKAESYQEWLEKIQFTISLDEAVREADYVQESVHESYKVKKSVFKSVDAAAPPDAVLASSSSALKMSVSLGGTPQSPVLDSYGPHPEVGR